MKQFEFCNRLTVPDELLKIIRALTISEKDELLEAILTYQTTGYIPEMTPVVQTCFRLIMQKEHMGLLSDHQEISDDLPKEFFDTDLSDSDLSDQQLDLSLLPESYIWPW